MGGWEADKSFFLLEKIKSKIENENKKIKYIEGI
jgi:hypothetical protein